MGILIVDDQPDIRESLRFLLEVHGHEGVCTAANGREALEVLATTNTTVDLILTDVNMPILSGIDVCQQVKNTPRLHDIPVIVMTGKADESVLEKAFMVGAHDFVPKPVSPTELLVRVRSALDLKRELDKRKARERELVEVTRRLERVNAKLRRLSLLDELTGIANRRFFNLLIRQEWGRAARESLPLSLVMIDIDSFKAFNDQYGHPAGDDCLTRVASTLQGLMKRPGDAVARYGGEEFVVLLSNTNENGALTVAESLRAAVAMLNVEHLGSCHGRVTISLGSATALPKVGGSSDDLIQAADQAIYRAKVGGRNRVEMAEKSSA